MTANLSGTIVPSVELPWAEGGNPLYLKNLRKVYLDEPSTAQEQLVPVLTGLDINETITTVNGFLALDAKKRNTDLTTALTVFADAIDSTTLDSFRKEFDYTTAIDGDVITYTLEYRFYNIN